MTVDESLSDAQRSLDTVLTALNDRITDGSPFSYLPDRSQSSDDTLADDATSGDPPDSDSGGSADSTGADTAADEPGR